MKLWREILGLQEVLLDAVVDENASITYNKGPIPITVLCAQLIYIY